MKPYEDILLFSQDHLSLTKENFETALSNGLNLFSTGEDFDFEGTEKTVASIRKSLPYLRRIFRKPIIELKEEEKIVPVEAAGRINAHSVSHLSSHTELWDKIEGGNLTPRQLLSKTYQDHYTFYENLVVVSYVDHILSFLRKKIQLLSTLLYSTRFLNINLLDRNNHPNYYEALGILQKGYLENCVSFSERANITLQSLQETEKSLLPYLQRPIYRYGHKVKKDFTLHKTNILAMQKDYHKIYVSYRSLFAKKKNEAAENPLLHQPSYHAFVKALIVFSLLSYGFRLNEGESIELSHLFLNATFASASLTVAENENGDLLLSFRKEKDYRLLFSFQEEKLALSPSVDRTFLIRPEQKEGSLLLSLEDIESFRRIQQVLLLGLISCSETFTACPFCGKKMEKEEKKESYLCPSCKERIQKRHCPENGKDYFESTIYRYRLPLVNSEDPYERKRLQESLYRFRNITPIGEYGELLCPYCHQDHTKQ